MSSIDRAKSVQVGVRMAIKVAGVSAAAFALAMAASAQEARAGVKGAHADEQNPEVAAANRLRVEGLGRFSCISRGPAMPPEPPEDFSALVAEVPS